MRGIEVPQAPPRSARPPHRAGAFATFEAIENAGVFGWHKVRSTEVAAPTRRSGTARLISLTPKVRFRPKLAFSRGGYKTRSSTVSNRFNAAGTS